MNNLKKLRKDKGLTQQELAQEMETTKLTISNWENEKHTIKADKAQQLADYFGVSVGYLLGYSNNPKRYDDEIVMEPEERLTVVHSRERYDKEKQERMFKDFVTFFRDNIIFISDDEILSLFSMVQAANLNNATPRGRQFTDLIFSDNDESKQIIDDYSLVFGNEFARNDLEEQIHGYIYDETKSKEKTEKLLKVLQSAYGERDYLD
ncbi:helix-turn-helix transcriptional regulator [Streptococcus salivarius]|jgi:transcriptional regulator with XRE-family HTH domain|uniref:helix-turn-helix domain-containing protein n=1 Tax=Streptococcus salivarius TaxID=1304 RepID=UPI000E4CA34D|nr:helix-turn-helix transcriptional regulator [Streptococcus salivarius]MDU4410897.1 helix-turn-helix transcriptional regulator [Streptococcus sp.]RGW72153.1 XRE family transcriptional regulator [Streptococcus salivarius]